MKKHFPTLLFTLLIASSFGQTPWHASYSFSDKIFEKLSRDTLNFEAAQELSHIGEYEKALEVWDRDERKMPPSLLPEQSAQFSKLKAVPAKDFILEKAKTEQIIILNEAHQQPYHRVFTTSLLHELYKAGFRYFGAETMSNDEASMKELRKNKYPTLNSGYYTREPLYGNLVREAIQEGYEIFAYETTRLGESDSAGINLREVDQARNIKKILDKDPTAKILIHCGWDHIVEAPYPSWGKAMAGRLYEYTGIDPFTIDQTKLTEHSSAEYQNPYWTAIKLDYYAMFVDSNAQPFYGPKESKQYDARVYHPKTTWIQGRPHWVFENKRVPYMLKQKISVQYPCLVYAFIPQEIKETEYAIPFDLIELKSPSDKKALSLKKGQSYTIVVRDQQQKEQRFEIKVE